MAQKDSWVQNEHSRSVSGPCKQNYGFDENGEILKNFESLSMVLIDNCNKEGDVPFNMSEYYFAEDLIDEKKNSKKEDESVRTMLKKCKQIVVPISSKTNMIKVVYIDIYGNEFMETKVLEE